MYGLSLSSVFAELMPIGMGANPFGETASEVEEQTRSDGEGESSVNALDDHITRLPPALPAASEKTTVILPVGAGFPMLGAPITTVQPSGKKNWLIGELLTGL